MTDIQSCIFDMLLKSLSLNHVDISSIYNNLGNVYNFKNEYNLALENYEKGLSCDHPDTPTSLHNIAGIHRIKKKYDFVLGYYKKNYFVKTITIEYIGLVYMDLNSFEISLKYVYLSLTLDSIINTWIKLTCSRNSATIYLNINSYDHTLTVLNQAMALHYYIRSHLMYQKNYGSEHEKVKELQSFINRLNFL